MKLRIGYLKERKLLEDVETWTVQDLENEIRKLFVFDSDTNIGIYLGAQRVSGAKSSKITQLGIVSGDLLTVKIGPNEQESNNVESSSKNVENSSENEEKMEVSISQPSTSTEPIQTESNVSLIKLDTFLDLLLEHVQKLGFEKFGDYSLDDPIVKNRVFYFKSNLTKIQIRCACNLFFNGKGLQNAQLNVTMINGDNFIHFDRLDFDSQTKSTVFEDFIQELKTEIFGPDNPMLKAMFCGDSDLTLKLFKLCGLETVIALRQTCKIAYKKSNSRFLDQHYWKGELIQAFGEDQLPVVDDREPTPYRKTLFKKMREQEKAAFFNSVLQRGRQEAVPVYHIPHAEVYDPLAIPPRNPHPAHRNYDPLQFDPLQNFNDNFYGQEVYRPRNPNPYVPNTPIIYPHNHDDPLRAPRQPQNPDMPRGPFGRRDPNRFI